MHADVSGPNRVTHELPDHLVDWKLPPGWQWGAEGVSSDYRHFQEVVDALGRSLSLVTVPDPAHAEWLASEARHLAHRSHPSIPTTYHFWTSLRENQRGPGYLRRWIVGESIGARVRRQGKADIPSAVQMFRAVGSTLAYLHDTSTAHGALSPDTVWVSPTGVRLWVLGWQWAMPRAELPEGLAPDRGWHPVPPEWADGAWTPDECSDQWQLAALLFFGLTGELPPSVDVPPLMLVRPEVPQALASVVDRALLDDPTHRHASVRAMLRALDRAGGGRTITLDGTDHATSDTDEARLRWALAEDYEVLASLGSGTFGSVWRVRDLALERIVALKMLHPHIASDDRAVTRFRREARLAAQLAHPAIVPIYDWDQRGDVSWYTMELAEGGSVADLLARAGPRPVAEVASQIELVLDALASAHVSGIVHRDLKPENLLIDRYRRWRLADFGIANDPGEEVVGTTGTPAFAAPEQLLGEAQGPAVDCFSMAAIVAFVLSGVPPFGESDLQQILARQLSGAADLELYPPTIAEWLRRGLQPDPEQRFPDAAEMRSSWRHAVRTLLDGRRHSGAWWRRILPEGEEEVEVARRGT
jgi:eukaryotic-like serine/threonine-protein kinase